MNSVPPRWRQAAPWLVLALVAAAYVGAVHLGFCWDDEPLVVRNRLLASLGNIPRFFAMDLWDGSPVGPDTSGYYRPLMLVSLALDRALFGLQPAGYHVQSLLWHLLAVGMFMRLVRPILGWRGTVLAAVLFGLHPVQSEAVAWIAARNDPMAAAFGFVALERATERGRGGAVFLFTVLAGLTKESVVLLPGLLLFIDLARGRRPEWARLWPMLLAIGVVGAAHLAAGVGSATLPSHAGWALLWRRGLWVLGTLGALVVAPVRQSAGRSIEWLNREPLWWVAIGIAAMSLIVGLTWRSRQRRVSLAGLGWAVLAFAPTLVPVADKGLIGERYLYLSMAGIGVAAGALAGRRALWWAGLVAGPSLWLVQARLPVWIDDVRLWTDAVAHSPSPFTHSSLGYALRERGEPRRALSQFVQALDDPQPDLSVCPRLVGTALAAGSPSLAATMFERARGWGCDPTGASAASASFAAQGAVALAYEGRWEEARALLDGAHPDPEGRDQVVRAALARRDGDTDAWARIARGWRGVPPLEDQVRQLIERSAAPR